MLLLHDIQLNMTKHSLLSTPCTGAFLLQAGTVQLAGSCSDSCTFAVELTVVSTQLDCKLAARLHLDEVGPVELCVFGMSPLLNSLLSLQDNATRVLQHCWPL